MWEKEHPTAVVLDDQPLWLEAMGNLLNRLGMEVGRVLDHDVRDRPVPTPSR